MQEASLKQFDDQIVIEYKRLMHYHHHDQYEMLVYSAESEFFEIKKEIMWKYGFKFVANSSNGSNNSSAGRSINIE